MKTLVLVAFASVGALAGPDAVTSTGAQNSSVMAANQTSAAVSLKTIAMAQTSYAVTCGNGGYAATLKALSTPPGGRGEGYLPADLSKAEMPEKNGFQFAMAAGAKSAAGPTDCNGSKTVTKFYASAIPLKLGVTGSKSYAVNDSLTIWVLDGGVAPKEPFGPPAKPLN